MADEIVAVHIRYDGLDAEDHELNLDALGESMQGISRLLAVIGNAAVTGRYVSQSQAMSVRVVAKEPHANCFSFQAVLQFVQQQGMLQGAIGAFITAAISYIIAKAANRKEEVKHLAASLEKAIDALAQGNTETRESFTAMIPRLVEALRPAAKQAVEPVGRSCEVMRIGASMPIDKGIAAAIREDAPDSIDQERIYTLLVTELDLETGSAKVRLVDEIDTRIKATITDPALKVTGNAYAAALVSALPVRVAAKAALRDGEITKLYISNTA